MPGLLDQRWHEPCLLRVHCDPAETPWCACALRIHRRSAESQRQHSGQPVEHGGARRRYAGSRDNEQGAEIHQFLEALQIRYQIHEVQGPIYFVYRELLTTSFWNSAFWGQSFVAELTRISAHGEKKLKLRRASLAKQQSQNQPQPSPNGGPTRPESEAVGNDTADSRDEKT